MVKKLVMKCFYRSKPFDEEGKPVRKRMFREWRDRGLFESTEQHVCDQARGIRKMDGCHDLNWKQLKDK